ncbi:SWIM zinc finger domain-containing protein [Lactiplantibacillus nangangensis]|uniref:SWIM zinc finger domain-containing protein n=1 Tax=Lactiplantibacillus nangangensis TaxID=2559917 RepID=A0ABW1SII3_9LACO|nr:SWIM zinc finger family protein [Lactiplantibacillus nangangensis]
MAWQSLFQPQILARGVDYYQRGLVTEFKSTGDGVEATVEGSQLYDVAITFRHDKIQHALCDCPYAAEGNYCKHMAAVLLYNDKPFTAPKITQQTQQVATLVAQATEQQVRDFLTTLLQQDPQLTSQFKLMVTKTLSETDQRVYEDELDSIFDDYLDQDDFIDYEDAGDFESELSTFFKTVIQPMIAQKQLSMALSLVETTFVNLENLDIDDSNGELFILTRACSDAWQQILSQADLPLKQQAFAWFQQKLADSNDLFDNIIEDLLFNNFQDASFLTRKLALTETMLNQASTITDDWEREINGSKWAGYHLQVLDAQSASPATITAFCEANLSYHQVRQYYIDFCIAQKNDAQAIQLLVAGKKQDQHSLGASEDYSRQLKTLYQRLGDQTHYQQELWSLLTHQTTVELADYRELKHCFSPDNWLTEREKLFNSMRPRTNLEPLYAEDHLYHRLLTAVLAEDGLTGVETYGPILKAKFSDQLCQKLATTVEAMATTTGSREHYRELVAVLNQMKRYPNGRQLATELIAGWRKRYARRSAMMDELNRFDQIN